MNENDIFLTVWCFAYNFADYIRDTFEGFLRQQTNFRFRIIVFDDASTDGTSDIVREYAEKYPDYFIPYIAEENTFYQYKKRLDILDELRKDYQRGKYIAECEGDDYWIDPLKLQKQVDFLEMHPECSMVVHPAKWIFEGKDEEFVLPHIHGNQYLDEWEMIAEESGRIQTASFVYRSKESNLNGWLKLRSYGEYHRRLYEFARGAVYYMDDSMSVYRALHKGSWTEVYFNNVRFRMENQLLLQTFLESYDEFTDYRYHDAVQMMINDHVHDAMLMDTNVDIDEYLNEIDTSDLLSNRNKQRYRIDRERLAKIVRCQYNFSEEEEMILKGCEKIVIYGSGNSSEYVRSVLESKHYDISGYVISDDRISSSKDKPVWRMCEYPFPYNETAVVIGVGQFYEHAVRRELNRYGVQHIVDSFWIKEN